MGKHYIYTHPLPEMLFCLKGSKFNDVKLIRNYAFLFYYKSELSSSLFCAHLPCISAKNIPPTYTYVNPN